MAHSSSLNGPSQGKNTINLASINEAAEAQAALLRERLRSRMSSQQTSPETTPQPVEKTRKSISGPADLASYLAETGHIDSQARQSVAEVSSLLVDGADNSPISSYHALIQQQQQNIGRNSTRRQSLSGKSATIPPPSKTLDIPQPRKRTAVSTGTSPTDSSIPLSTSPVMMMEPWEREIVQAVVDYLLHQPGQRDLSKNIVKAVLLQYRSILLQKYGKARVFYRAHPQVFHVDEQGVVTLLPSYTSVLRAPTLAYAPSHHHTRQPSTNTTPSASTIPGRPPYFNRDNVISWERKLTAQILQYIKGTKAGSASIPELTSQFIHYRHHIRHSFGSLKVCLSCKFEFNLYNICCFMFHPTFQVAVESNSSFHTSGFSLGSTAVSSERRPRECGKVSYSGIRTTVVSWPDATRTRV